MKKLIFFLLVTSFCIGQVKDDFFYDVTRGDNLKNENYINKYSVFDFSNLWIETENQNVFGIFGKDYERLKIKIISVKKNEKNNNEYFVIGKSNLNGMISDFSGSITITEIKEVKAISYGVDDEYKDKGIKTQGLLIGNYEFYETNNKKNIGVFKGKVYSKWYLTSENKIQYDNISTASDSYTNNSFIGVWETLSGKEKKLCIWSDYRIPNLKNDFDIGAGMFSPTEKYYDNGWKNYADAWFNQDKSAIKKELEEWWK
jgi:hypothetical protein